MSARNPDCSSRPRARISSSRWCDAASTLIPLGAQIAAAWRPNDGGAGWLLTDKRSSIDYLTDLELWSAARLGMH